MPFQSTPSCSRKRLSSIEMIARIMSGEMSLYPTWYLYWSKSRAMGVPAASVIVVTSGSVPLSNSDETFSTADAARFDAIPTPLAAG
ncbi:Uncharacterised protein [Mycobacteroides abscessus subsp. abscessus]|nr:Uncharacterised protein [Mycobacteroides abscessus subsp. abscessus]